MAYAEGAAVEPYQQHIDAGLRAFKLRHFTEAREHFMRAHAVSPSGRTLRGLGFTSFALNNFTIAEEELQGALRTRVGPLSQEQRREVEKLLGWMRVNLGPVRLEISPPRGRASIDGKPVNQSPTLLDAGEHQLNVGLEGYEPYEAQFEVLPPRELLLRVTLLRKPQVPRQETSRLWASAGGAGLFVSLVGGVLLGAGLAERARLEDPGGPQLTRSEFEDGQSTVHWLTGAGGGLLALGLIGIATGLILRLTRDDSATTTSTTSAAVVGSPAGSLQRAF